MTLSDLFPKVSKAWLISLAGFVWGVVGAFLCRLAFSWLQPIEMTEASLFIVFGLAIAFAAFKFGLSKVAQKNIKRLNTFENGAPIYAFQSWKSYAMIGIMIPLGFTLRHSMIPKEYLAIPYLGMGGSLFLSSTIYFKSLFGQAAKP
ncbi:conserved hypothetical protein [Chloroherpeton thalassium ATCC 35110]|uniref:Uncharacterized protein n=1 Tax=Chloroherpeton thalassium (strain ATCC 35110 / GB-78) TaxID=517418 RepID=B3QXN5_CHLT3|nr:hypothetical protein [Chloroherpeton thalassium]ACF14950.1 conserved hypothetical protein [Chloroherpeton thalassium ATCC 35110]